MFSYRVNGKQRWESCRTLEEARRAKSARQTDIGRGEFEERSRVTLHEYLTEWIERYQGTGRRGFREETRGDCRALLDKYARRHFPARTKLSDVTPSAIAGFIGWLCDPVAQAKHEHAIKAERARSTGKGPPPALAPDARRERADSTVRNAIAPLRAALSTARREGLIRHNPVVGVALPHRERIEEDEAGPRPFPNGVMELVVDLGHAQHRLMFELPAATGVRRSELLALEGRHLALDGDQPHIKIRQRVRRRRGAGLVVGPLKSRHARRDLPIPLDLADRMRALATPDDGLVFTSTIGTLLDPGNLSERACSRQPARRLASSELGSTRSDTQLPRGCSHEGVMPCRCSVGWGITRRAFTLSTYVHLLEDDLGEPLAKGASAGANNGQTSPTPLDTVLDPSVVS